jgi:hypothetical protein
MPTFTGQTSNPIQPNATSLDQNRRNWQRLSTLLNGGTIASHVATAAPITNTGGEIGLAFNTSQFSVVGGDLTLAVLTTAGDLLVYNGSTHTATRLPAGPNGYVLTATTSSAVGVAWEPATGGGGGVGTISQVLTAGNDAAGLTLTDLGELDVNNVISMAAGGVYQYNSVPVIQAQTALYNYYLGGAGNLTGTGDYNLGVGAAALPAVTSGSGNTAVGAYTLNVATTAIACTAVGGGALQAVTSGYYNTAVGFNAGTSYTGGICNTAVGYGANQSGTIGLYNTCVGYNAGVAATGSRTTLLGANAGAALTTGNSNTLIGAYAGTNLTTGNYNTIVGYCTVSGTLSNNVILADGQNNIRLQFDSSGNGTIGGSLTAASFSGIGTALTALNATNITSGVLATAYGGTNNLIAVKGDLLTFSTTVAKLGVGTDGQVLTARSSATNGIDWETAVTSPVTNVTPGDGLTLTSGTLSFLGSSLTSVGTITTGTWNAGVIQPTYGGTGVNNGSNTITLGGSLTTSGAFTTTLTTTANTNVTLPTSGTLLANPLTTKGDVIVEGSTAPARLAVGTNGQVLTANSAATNGVDWETPTTSPVTAVTPGDGLTLTSGTLSMTGANITTVGTITTGTWDGTIIQPTYGGTGVNNGSNTITLAGTLTTSGAFGLTLTTTATTAATFPAGTTTLLATNGNGSALTNLNATNVGSGTLATTYGGTGNLLTTKGDLLTYDTTTVTKVGVGTNNQILIADSTQSGGLRWGNNLAFGLQSLSSDPGSPTASEVWYNTATSTPRIDTAYGVATIPMTLFVNTTSSQSVTNTTAETLFNQNVSIPANTLTVGSCVHLEAFGQYTNTVADTITFKVKLGSAIVVNSGTLTAVIGTNKQWSMEGWFTITATGASGTLNGAGFVGINDGNFTALASSAVTVDTTSAMRRTGYLYSGVAL